MDFPMFKASDIGLTEQNEAKFVALLRSSFAFIHSLVNPWVSTPSGQHKALLLTANLDSKVLEHIFNPPTEVLGEIRRIIRPNGKLILSVPNIASLRNRTKLLFGISPIENPNLSMRS